MASDLPKVTQAKKRPNQQVSEAGGATKQKLNPDIFPTELKYEIKARQFREHASLPPSVNTDRRESLDSTRLVLWCPHVAKRQNRKLATN